MTRYLSLGLMIYNLKRVFNRLNPDEEVDNINFDPLDYPCGFQTALHDMADQYPQYEWFEEESLEEIEDMENEQKIRELKARGVSEEELDRIRDEMDMQTLKRGWKRGWIAGKETYIKTVPIKPHTKDKAQGRIQTTCNREFIGLEAKITIVKPEEPNKESTESELNEYE